MENALTLASYMGPAYLLWGLTILLYAPAWQKVVDKLQKDHYSLVPVMLLYFLLGLIIVKMYNVWAWNVYLLVTLTGWLLVVKSVFYFLLPGSVIKSSMGLGKNKGLLYITGLVSLVVGLVLSYYTYFA